jgi:hypothetical protein
MTVTLPGFSADRALDGPRGSYQFHTHLTIRIEPALRLAQDRPCRTSATSSACQQCWDDCISGCDNPRDCFPGCRAGCGGQPRSPAPIGGGSGPPTPPPISYGNYCGPGWGDPTGATPPIDAVDAVCRTHDLCYQATTYFNCGCDRALLLAMPTAITVTPSLLGKAAGNAAIAHFAGAPCTCCLPVFPPFPSPCVPLPAGVGGVGPC